MLNALSHFTQSLVLLYMGTVPTVVMGTLDIEEKFSFSSVKFTGPIIWVSLYIVLYPKAQLVNSVYLLQIGKCF